MNQGSTYSFINIYFLAIFTTPCPPGHYGIYCLPCPLGYYKDDFSNKECRPCIPPNSNTVFNKTSETSYLCQQECRPGLVSIDKNPECLSNFLYYVQYLGGLYAVIIMLITLPCILLTIIKKNLTQEQLKKNYKEERAHVGIPNLFRAFTKDSEEYSPDRKKQKRPRISMPRDRWY